ncbi:hypothetical protein Ctu_3p00200 (plasmid) [Cronobacter turicensis z3032]|uniref:Uncharacterized protein n=1 Tax=Cronobacter turicensis (strain DSM 18703 / CCUG 55852 / LMG 23827 / z3032) TaxID=693216 RepID=C9Y5T0_CROTZ|nr:hypothetical protein CSK29544_3p0010 [Cronobacter sakazakii]CBA34725.1 hypothetical protein Ctu_3p00200 [Cronobacter turicensis z3032]
MLISIIPLSWPLTTHLDGSRACIGCPGENWVRVSYSAVKSSASCGQGEKQGKHLRNPYRYASSLYIILSGKGEDYDHQ